MFHSVGFDRSGSTTKHTLAAPSRRHQLATLRKQTRVFCRNPQKNAQMSGSKDSSMPSLSESSCRYSPSVRKLRSTTDEAPVGRENFSERTVVPSSFEVQTGTRRAHCAQLLPKQYSRERPQGALSAQLAELGGPVRKASSALRQSLYTYSVGHKPKLCSSSGEKNATEPAGKPRGASDSMQPLFQYHGAPRGYLTNYYSRKHIAEQRARRRAVLGLDHAAPRRGERGAVPDVLLPRNRLRGRTNTTYTEKPSASVAEFHQEAEDESSFHTLQFSSLSDVQLELCADIVEKGTVRASDCSSRAQSSTSSSTITRSYPLPAGCRNGVAAPRIGSSTKIALREPSCAGVKVQRLSPTVALRTVARKKIRYLNADRRCVRERILSVNTAAVHRAPRSASTDELQTGHASLTRRGRVVRVVPVSPTPQSRRNEKRALSNYCVRTSAYLKTGNETQSLTAQQEGDCAPSISSHPKVLISFTASDRNGRRLRTEPGSTATDYTRNRLRLEPPQITHSQSQQQTVVSEADPAVVSQITEHSWMFPRDEYRPPLSPQIPFNLDEDEDATASAIVVTLTEEVPPSKAKTAMLCPENPSEFEERCHSTVSATSSKAGAGESAANCHTRRWRGRQFPNVESSQVTAVNEAKTLQNIQETPTGRDEDGIRIPPLEKIAATAGDQTGPLHALNESGETPHTPTTEWYTTLATAWLSSSATIAENLTYSPSSPECARQEHECKIDEKAPQAASRKLSSSKDSERRQRQQSRPLVIPSCVHVHAEEWVHQTVDENNLKTSQRDAAFLNGYTELAEVYCGQGCARTAHGLETIHASRCGQVRDGVDVDAVTPRALRQVQAQPRLHWEPKRNRGREKAKVPNRLTSTLSAASEQAAESATTFISPRACRDAHNSLHEEGWEQQQASKVFRPCGTLSWNDHRRPDDSGISERANAFATYTRLPGGCARKRHSRNTFLDGSGKHASFPSQAGVHESKPFSCSFPHKGARRTIDSEDDETTTSDDCSSTYSSRNTSRSSSVARQTDNNHVDGQLQQGSLGRAHAATPILSYGYTFPLDARSYRGKSSAAEVTHRAHGQTGETNTGGEPCQRKGPRGELNQASDYSCPLVKPPGALARDLEVTRTLSAQQTEPGHQSRVQEGPQGFAGLPGSDYKTTHVKQKEQPSGGGRTMWRFWGWTFGRCRQGGRIKREGP